MKAAVILSLAAAFPAVLLAQGDLTPPGGAPVAGMKTLTQVEPRTDVQKLAASPPYTISTPGSYYLTGNIGVATGNAINITAAGVTLDLNGFTISSGAGGGNGSAIFLSAAAVNATIRNGNITSGTTLSGSTFTPSGFSKGIDGTLTRSTMIENVSFSGIATTAIDCANTPGSTASYCTVRVARLHGIVAETVDHCNVLDAGNYGISASVVTSSRATVAANPSIAGISASGSVSDCTAICGTGYAIEGKSVINCYGYSTSSGIGIVADNVTNSTGISVSGIGIVGQNVNGSTGTSTSGSGISSELSPSVALTMVTGSVSNSKGGTNTGGFGIFSGTVSNSTGTSINGMGIAAMNTVTNSFGRGSASTYSIYSRIAIGCRGTGSLIFASVEQFCIEEP